jgi:hypothetical protein
MTIQRDNEEERMARVEHLLARLAENRVDAERVQRRRRRIISEFYSSAVRRGNLVALMRKILKRKSRRKNKK